MGGIRIRVDGSNVDASESTAVSSSVPSSRPGEVSVDEIAPVAREAGQQQIRVEPRQEAQYAADDAMVSPTATTTTQTPAQQIAQGVIPENKRREWNEAMRRFGDDQSARQNAVTSGMAQPQRPVAYQASMNVADANRKLAGGVMPLSVPDMMGTMSSRRSNEYDPETNRLLSFGDENLEELTATRGSDSYTTVIPSSSTWNGAERSATRKREEAERKQRVSSMVLTSKDQPTTEDEVTSRPTSVFNAPFGYRGKTKAPRLAQPSMSRPSVLTKRVMQRIKNSFSNKGVGNRIYGKMFGRRTLGFRDVGIGVREIVDAAIADPTTLSDLLGVDVSAMDASQLIDAINSRNVYVATFKPPSNRGQDVQRRRLRVLVNEERGLYLHPIMAAMYTADYDGDDMEISLDPEVAKLAKDPMDHMVGIDGVQSLNVDFLPNTPIYDIPGGKDAWHVVRECIFYQFSQYDRDLINPLVDAVLELGNASESGSSNDKAVAWGKIFTEARKLSDRVSALNKLRNGKEYGRERRDRLMSDLCQAVYTGMHQIRRQNIYDDVYDDDIVSNSDLPTPRTYSDEAIYKVLDGITVGEVPNNFQDLRIAMNSFLGNVEGKNAPFRFTADVGKMMKMDSRLKIGDGSFQVDPGDDSQMEAFFESTMKYAEAFRIAKEIKKAGRSEYYTQVMRTQVIHDVGFPGDVREDGSPRYKNFAEFLTAFADSYSVHSALINEANIVYLNTMEISGSSNRSLVSEIHVSENGVTISDVADPLISIYGSYSVGRLFNELSGSGVMGNVVDERWKGKPGHVTKLKKYGPDASKPIEREYADDIRELWVTGKYISWTIRKFKNDNTLLPGEKTSDIMDVLRMPISDVGLEDDVHAQLHMLMAIADKRTSSATKFNKNKFGEIETERTRNRRAKTRDSSDPYDHTMVGMMSEILKEIKRLDTGSRVIRPGFYAGIGSRDTPIEVQEAMTRVARRLADANWTVRSGHAKGADIAFERGARKMSEIYLPFKDFNKRISVGGNLIDFDSLPEDVRVAADRSVRYDHPAGRDMDRDSFAFKAHRRNYLQVMGGDESAPMSAFVACWTPVDDNKSHGTDQAIRIARKQGIPVFNAAEYDDIRKWEDDVINAALMSAQGRLLTTPIVGRADQMLWVNDAVNTLIMSNPDLFMHFGMDSPAGFLNSPWARKMIEYADNPEVLGGIYTSMVFDYRMDRVNEMKKAAFGSMIDPDVYGSDQHWKDDIANFQLAKDELASSSKVWSGIMKEFVAAATDGEESVFQILVNGHKPEQVSVSGERYAWDITYDAAKFWANPGDHTSLRSVMEDLDMDRSMKWSIIADIVRYWEHDAYLKTWEVGYQMEVGNDSSFDLMSAPGQGLMKTYEEFSQSFNRWGKVTQTAIEEEVIKAAAKFRRQKGYLTQTISRIANEPWLHVMVDDLAYADGILSVFDKSYAQTEKASQHPWTNYIYSALSYQRNGGYMNDITRTDDRLLGVQSVDSVTIKDVARVLSDPKEELHVYNEYGEKMVVNRDLLLEEALGRPVSNDVEDDLWEFLLANPRIAMALRVHSACVVADTKGKGFLGSTLSMKETIEQLGAGRTEDVYGHVKYLLRDDPVYGAIISLISKSRGSETRTMRSRIAAAERHLVACLYTRTYEARYDDNIIGITSNVLKDLGIRRKDLEDVLTSDYDKYLIERELPLYKEGSRKDRDDEAIRDADAIYTEVSRAIVRFVDIIQRNMSLDVPLFAESSNAITSFRDENAFLSNFYDTPVEFDGITYRNSEAAFQAQKCANPAERIRFKNMSGRVARKEGNKVKLREDWESIKEDIMRQVVKAKFSDPKMQEMLDSTGTKELIEGNTWDDTTWGVSNGVGKNLLGKILMDQRNVKPSFDITSVASFWDVVQELSGAKTSVSTGIEGYETYQYAEWASHISARDRYADLEAVPDEDIDASWDGAWTNVGIPIHVDETGRVVNMDEIIKAKEGMDVDEVVVVVPDGYTVKDKSTDSHGTQVNSLFSYMVSKRSNGAEAFNLKAKKSGIDGSYSITKMQGWHRMVPDGPNSTRMHMVNIDEIEQRLRDVFEENGGDENALLMTKLELAKMMLRENGDLGYDDLTLSNYMCIADLMIIRDQNNQIHLRSLEMLFSAIKHRLGPTIDEMTDGEIRNAADAIVKDNGDLGVGIGMSPSALDAIGGVRPCTRSLSTTGMRTQSSIFARNYDLLSKIAADAEVYGVRPIAPDVASMLHESNSKVPGIAETIKDARVARNYNVIGYAAAEDNSESVRWTVGGSNAIVIGKGKVSDKRFRQICGKAYMYGMTLIVDTSHIGQLSRLTDALLADAVPCGDDTLLIPCFDIRLNGTESATSNGGRFATFQAPYSRYVVSVEDSVNEFELGDAEAKPMRGFVDRIKVVDSGSEQMTAESLFPNVFKNPKFRHSMTEISFASGNEVRSLIAEHGVRCTIDYGVVEGGRGFERRVRDVNRAIERYRERWSEVDEDGFVRGPVECEPGDIVGWAQCYIVDQLTDEEQVVLAPIIPFPLHGKTRGVPQKFTVDQLAYVDNDNTLMSVNWSNTSDVANGFAKYFDSSGGANKGMMSFGDALDGQRTLIDGTPIDVYIAKMSTDSRKIGTDRRIKTMISLMALARMHGYNFARVENSFPDNPKLRQDLLSGRVPTYEWRRMLRDGNDITFIAGDDRMNAFLNFECRKVLANGGNPTDYLANVYTDENGDEHNTHVMWEFEAMFEQGMSYEDSLLRFLHTMDGEFCPNGLDDMRQDYCFRLFRERDGSVEGYDTGVLQMKVPHDMGDGRTAYVWDNVYIGMSFFGEDYSGFSRPNVNGASNFLDAMNTMSYYGVKLDRPSARLRAMWATSDMGRISRDGGAIGKP